MIKISLLPRFLLVGGSTAASYLGITYGLVEAFALNVTLASTVGCVFAVCYNYLLHYHWTFVSEAPHSIAMIRYLVMCAGGIAVNGLVMHFGTVLTSAHYMVVQLFAAVALVCWSLTLSSLWVFRR